MKLVVAGLAVTTASRALRIQYASPICRAPRCMPPLAIAPLVAPLSDNIWRMSPPVRVDGDTLRTWTITDEGTERVQLSIRSAGRPVEAKVELWQSPSFIPVTFTYCFDSGSDSPLHTILETPGLRAKTIAVYNTECGHCPFESSVAHTGVRGRRPP